MQFLPIDTEILPKQIFWWGIILCLICTFRGCVFSRREFTISEETVLPVLSFLEIFMCQGYVSNPGPLEYCLPTVC